MTDLGKQLENRIKAWRTELKNHVYTPVCAVSLHGFITRERLSLDEAEHRAQRGMTGIMYPFGHGDGGGGATRDILEFAERLNDLEGAPRTAAEHPLKYFERTEQSDIKQSGIPNRWTGELYLAWHRGTYSAQARTKAAMRRAENALRDAELWCALCGAEPPELRNAWEKLLYNQFHDINAGVSIGEVHKQAELELAEAAETCQSIARNALNRLVKPVLSQKLTFTIVNNLSFERDEWVELPCAEDEEWAYCQD